MPATSLLAGDKPQPYISLRPSAGAGTPRYEDWVHGLMEGFRCRPCTPPFLGWGQAPALHFSFDLGWCRHTKVRKLGAWVDGRVQVSPVHPTVPLAGD